MRLSNIIIPAIIFSSIIVILPGISFGTTSFNCLEWEILLEEEKGGPIQREKGVMFPDKKMVLMPNSIVLNWLREPLSDLRLEGPGSKVFYLLGMDKGEYMVIGLDYLGNVYSINTQKGKKCYKLQNPLSSFLKKDNEFLNKLKEIYYRLSSKMEEDPNSVSIANRYVFFGNYEYENGNYEEALKEFENAIQNSPTNGAAWKGIAMTYIKMKNYQGALNAFQKANTLDPFERDLYLRFSVHMLEREDLTNAFKLLKKAYFLFPKDGNVIYNLGICSFLLGDKRLAEILSTKLMGIDRSKAQNLKDLIK
jgi:tetratricopeptide (TPR) repeat protein